MSLTMSCTGTCAGSQQSVHPAAVGDRVPLRHVHLQSATDEALLAWVRQGNGGAFTELYRRHYPDSLRYATRLTRRGSHHDSPDDVVSEAMRKVLSALRRGHGPTIGFRQYLFTAVRSVTATARVTTHERRADHRGDHRADPRADHRGDHRVDDHADAGAPATDDGLDAIVAMEAFESLPHRWRQVLWMTKVDGLTPTEAAPLIGLSPNSVAALAVRAREALRVAFVRAHRPRARTHNCRVVLDLVARRAVVQLPHTRELFVTKHLTACESCRYAAADIERELDQWSRLGDWDPVAADSPPAA